MFQGVFDALLAKKIVSNLLFEMCSRFQISHIVWDIFPHLGSRSVWFQTNDSDGVGK